MLLELPFYFKRLRFWLKCNEIYKVIKKELKEKNNDDKKYFVDLCEICEYATKL